MKLSSIYEYDRPREKLQLKGPDALTNTELMAILLHTGTRKKNVLELSKDILSTFPGEKILSVSISELCKIKGIHTGKASSIVAALELSKRLIKLESETLMCIESPKEIAPFVTDIRSAKKEHFVALYLNARNQLIQREVISVGTINASLVHPREVFEPAIRLVASSVILIHNHPSGSVEPSDADIAVTKRLVEVSKILGIEVVDHIIVSQTDMFSFREKGIVF